MPLMGCIYCILVYMDVYVPLKGGIEGLCIIKVEYCARIFKYKTFEEQPKKRPYSHAKSRHNYITYHL